MNTTEIQITKNIQTIKELLSPEGAPYPLNENLKTFVEKYSNIKSILVYEHKRMFQTCKKLCPTNLDNLFKRILSDLQKQPNLIQRIISYFFTSNTMAIVPQLNESIFTKAQSDFELLKREPQNITLLKDCIEFDALLDRILKISSQLTMINHQIITLLIAYETNKETNEKSKKKILELSSMLIYNLDYIDKCLSAGPMMNSDHFDKTYPGITKIIQSQQQWLKKTIIDEKIVKTKCSFMSKKNLFKHLDKILDEIYLLINTGEALQIAEQSIYKEEDLEINSGKAQSVHKKKKVKLIDEERFSILKENLLKHFDPLMNIGEALQIAEQSIYKKENLAINIGKALRIAEQFSEDLEINIGEAL